jgi:hypothetical protein
VSTEPQRSGLILSDQEREWLHGGIPIDLALQKILKNHFSEKCITCGKFIGNHSLKAARRCVLTEFKKSKSELGSQGQEAVAEDG